VDAAPLVLPYATAQRDPARQRVWQILAALSLLPALIAPFVAFTFHTSPYDAAREIFSSGTLFGSEFPLECLGLSFFIIYPLLAWRLRRMLWRRARGMELGIALAGALVAIAPACIVAGYILFEVVRSIIAHDSKIVPMEWLSLFGLVGILAGGGTMAIRIRRRDGAVAIDALLIGAYLANAAFCLLAFHDDADVGDWLTLSAAAILAVQFALLPAAARRANAE
jgi:hypothetical protein